MNDMTSFARPRKRSIDIMRGLTLFLMLFVNDLFEPGVPQWLVHTKAETDGMGLADWVFPGFLFMVGMSVPFAIDARRKMRNTNVNILLHILIRTVSLLIIGVLMLNSTRISPELSGMNRFAWAIAMYVCVFLIWNQYPPRSRFGNVFLAMRWLGIAGLIVLAAIFRSGTPESPGWLITGWWGILGLIGWGYFSAALIYLFAGKRILTVVIAWLCFLALNILSQSDVYTLPEGVQRIFGVITGGSVPTITLAGLVAALIMRRKSLNSMQVFLTLVISGIICLAAGFILRHWFIISKIQGTPSWGMICNGISFVLIALLYIWVDVMGKTSWGKPFEATGKNSLTTYLAPDIIYYLCWGLSIPLFFYKQEGNTLLAVGGSLVWAFAMMGLSGLLSRIHVRLRL